MKAVIRQEWKARGGKLLTLALTLLFFNGIAVALQHIDGADLLNSHDNAHSSAWGLAMAITNIAIFATWIIGPGKALIHYAWELKRQIGGHSRSLLLTIPRTGATILGGKLAFGIAEFLAMSLLAILCSGANVVSMISVNSGKTILEVVAFGWREAFLPNVLPLAFLLALALVFYAFVYAADVFGVMALTFCRSKIGVFLIGVVVLAHAGLLIALGHHGYWVLLIPMALLLVLQLPFSKVAISELTCFLFGIVSFIDWPLRAIEAAANWIPWRHEISCHLPLMAAKETFCHDSFNFINGFLQMADSMVNNGHVNLPMHLLLTLLAFAVAYFVAAAWYFDHRLEE